MHQGGAERIRRSILCGTIPGPAAGRWELPTTLSYRARTFLPLVSQRATALVRVTS